MVEEREGRVREGRVREGERERGRDREIACVCVMARQPELWSYRGLASPNTWVSSSKQRLHEAENKQRLGHRPGEPQKRHSEAVLGKGSHHTTISSHGLPPLCMYSTSANPVDGVSVLSIQECTLGTEQSTSRQGRPGELRGYIYIAIPRSPPVSLSILLVSPLIHTLSIEVSRPQVLS